MSRRRPPRNLSQEERDLWRQVQSGARPLRPRSKSAKPEAPPTNEAQEPAPQQPAALPPASAPAALSRRLQPATIDHRTRSRLGRGLITVDARLDLHGLTQDRAHRRLVRFLTDAREHGKRIVLVITGKGRAGSELGGGEERGVLRRQVPHWLAGPDLAAVVAGFSEAHAVHGGAGALYVRLRRKRLT